MAKRVFLIHGWGSSPADGWKPWLKRELEARGFVVIVPQMPDTEKPKMDAWLAEMKRIVGKADSDTFFVGHSLGVVCILRYLEMLKGEEKTGGAVLVAGLAASTGIPELENFFPYPFEWAKIKAHCRKFISINSDNDYHIPLSHGEEFREKLGAELIVMHSHGHFSSADGYFEMPVVLEAVLTLTTKH
jgi:uncharacterized protein